MPVRCDFDVSTSNVTLEGRGKAVLTVIITYLLLIDFFPVYTKASSVISAIDSGFPSITDGGQHLQLRQPDVDVLDIM